MDGPPTPLTVFTIGHSNLTEEQFLAMLDRHQIAIVVDVRTAPYSRYAPQFNRDSLRLMLKEAGVRYAYAGEKLGGRPNDPGCYRQGVIPEPGANYLEEVDYVAVEQRDWYRDGIQRLLDLAAGQRAAVMCSEEDPHTCHRHHLISRTLLNQGVRVLHIRRGGETTEAEVTPQQMDLLGALRKAGA